MGHRLVETGHSVLFAPAYRMVQELLAAKRDLDLPQGAKESEVLFTLIAERYERRSLVITPNPVFSEWERIFANPMVAVVATRQVIHHSGNLELDVTSCRTRRPSNRDRNRKLTGKNASPGTPADPHQLTG